MLAEIGHIALILALLVAAAQSSLPLWGAVKNDGRLMGVSTRAAFIQFILIAFSFTLLTAIFITSDFSVELAAKNSHSAKPLLYKISGVWGNHEGSMLLWMLILAFFGALMGLYGRALPLSLKARALAVQGMIGFGFLAFILFTSNPFARLAPAPIDGLGLNPLLQDPGLAIHPPFLYLGYVGFSVAFSLSVAALMEGRVDALWARWLRPWVLLAWSFLTIGITLGSVWAYYELGWGGWWMWDPVENVSFMPWLAGTALLHSIMVLGTRHSMASWTVLLGISTFSLSLIGTFVVRSGVLVSVHSFAVDPARGVVILLLILLATGGALTLYALRAPKLRGREPVSLMSREGGLALNNLLLVSATATVFIGTFYPLFIDAISTSQISVGKPYFDLTFAPIMLVLIGFMGIAPLLKWREARASTLKPFAIKSCALLLTVTLLTWVFGKSILGGLALGVAAYLAYATLVAFGRRLKFGQVPVSKSLQLLTAQSAATYGFVLAHLGIAIFTAGATFMSVWANDNISRISVGESLETSGYVFTLDSVTPGRGDNYDFIGAKISVRKDGALQGLLASQRRYYPVRQMFTTEAGYRFSPRNTLFAAIGEGNPNDGYIVRVYSHPYVVWIWIGALLMALAGFISMCDRRLKAGRDEA